jgi:hypothetical protein
MTTDAGSENPYAAYRATIEASVAHEATHVLGWRLPCHTCRDLRAAENAALARLRPSDDR